LCEKCDVLIDITKTLSLTVKKLAEVLGDTEKRLRRVEGLLFLFPELEEE